MQGVYGGSYIQAESKRDLEYLNFARGYMKLDSPVITSKAHISINISKKVQLVCK